MKKKGLIVILSLLVCLTSFVSTVFAEEKLGEQLIANGDFSYSAGELAFPDPVFGNQFGDAFNWGSLSFDSHALAVVDPDDSENAVMKLSYSDNGQAWSSFFRFLALAQNTTYTISIDFKIVGTTDNIGFRFAGAPALEIVFLNHESKTAIEGKSGWYNVSFDFATGTGSYDSIAMWFNSASSVDNYALVDNISIQAAGSETELNVGGTFEGFLEYASGANLAAEANGYGFYGANGTAGNGNAVLNNAGVLGAVAAFDDVKYQVSFDFKSTDLTGADLNFAFVNDSNTSISPIAIITDGVVNQTVATLNTETGVYAVSFPVVATAVPTSLELRYEGNDGLIIDHLSVQESITVPDNPFDPEETYYEDVNMIVNGDFTAFADATVFSEAQLEGAWGSVNLDGPATIAVIGEDHVMKITKTVGKSYSSAFLIIPTNLEVGDLVRLSYDYKLETTLDPAQYTEINSSFVGVSNVSYYTIGLKSLVNGDLTEGAELLNMPLVVSDLGEGWHQVTLDFQITSEFLIKCNSIRWLFTPASTGDVFYVDDVEMHLLSTEEPTTLTESVSITQGDQDVSVGETVQLSAVVLPTEAENKNVTWSSSNVAVATVDANGLVTAVAAGACEISVTTVEGSHMDSIVVSVVSPVVEPTGLGGWWFGIIGGALVLCAGAVFAVLKFRKKL